MTHPTADDLMLDDAWLTEPAKQSRWRMILVAVLVAALCFLAGALVQKHFGATSQTAAAPGTPSGMGLPNGVMPQGGFPGGMPTPGAPGMSAPSQDTSGATTDTTPSVIGTVVKIDGDTWTVKDLGGTRHQVRVTGTTTITRETTISARQVHTGAQVDVSGTQSNGNLTADDVTLR